MRSMFSVNSDLVTVKGTHADVDMDELFGVVNQSGLRLFSLSNATLDEDS